MTKQYFVPYIQEYNIMAIRLLVVFSTGKIVPQNGNLACTINCLFFWNDTNHIIARQITKVVVIINIQMIME